MGGPAKGTSRKTCLNTFRRATFFSTGGGGGGGNEEIIFRGKSGGKNGTDQAEKPIKLADDAERRDDVVKNYM